MKKQEIRGAGFAAGLTLALAATPGNAFIMPLPVFDGKQIAQASTMAGKAKEALKLARQGTALIRSTQRLIDGGVLGLLPYAPLPEGIIRDAVLETASTGGVPWRSLASGVANVENMGDFQKKALRVGMESIQRGSLDPRSALHLIPDDALGPESREKVRSVRNAVARGRIAPEDIVRHLPPDARHAAGLAQNPSEAMAWAAGAAGQAARGGLAKSGVKVPEWAKGIGSEAGKAWSAVGEKAPWAQAYAAQSVREPVRATLGAMSHSVHPALLSEVPGHDMLARAASAPPGADIGSAIRKQAVDTGGSIAKDVWRNSEQQAEQRKRDEALKAENQARHVHARPEDRAKSGNLWAAAKERKDATVAWARRSGVFDWTTGTDEAGNIPKRGPGPTRRRIVEEGGTLLESGQQIAWATGEIAEALPIRTTGRHLERMEGWLGTGTQAMRFAEGNWGIADATRAASEVLPPGLGARAANICGKLGKIGLKLCDWRPGTSGPVHSETTASATSAKFQDQMVEAAAQTEPSPGAAQAAAGTLAGDGRRQIGQAETGCPAPPSTPPPIPRGQHWAPPIASSGRTVLSDALYVDQRGLDDLSQEAREELHRERELIAGWTAKEAWGIATAEQGRHPAYQGQMEGLRERMKECEAVACDMRVVADATRQEGLLAWQELQLSLAALRLETARSMMAQELVRK